MFYEIWLGMNIMWEIALGFVSYIVIAAIIWLAISVVTIQKKASWFAAFKSTFVIGAVVTVVAFFTLPTLTLSSFSDMNYWLDWVTLTIMSVGVGAVIFGFIWPFMALKKSPS
jgi:hypothetical protein